MNRPTGPQPTAAPRYLLVDGHSVLHSWPDLRALHTRQPAAARHELIRRCSALHDSGAWRVTLVFDGRAGGKEQSPPGSLAVLYAPAHQTADSIIEKIVQAHAGRGEIVVVTADHAEVTAVESFGAYGHSPDWLLAEMAATARELQDSLDRHRQKKLT